jgi:type III secretion protein S
MESVEALVQIAKQGMMLMLILSLPVVIVSAVVGLLIGALQAVTQLQDQSLSFAVKFGAVMAVLITTGAWMAKELTTLFDSALAAAFK